MDTRVTERNEEIWESYCSELRAAYLRAGVDPASKGAQEALERQRTSYDFILHHLLEHLERVSRELLALPNGAERFAQHLAQLAAQARTGFEANCLRYHDRMCQRKRRRFWHIVLSMVSGR